MVRKRELSIGISVLLIATSAYLLGWTNLFTIKQIEITGSPNPEITSLVMRSSQLTIGQKMARVEPRTVENRLKDSGIDWLESVDISRNWISGKVLISLKARNALARIGDQFVDASGAIFTSPIEIKRKLPELSASDLQNRASGLELYLQLPMSFRDQISKITVSSQENFQFQVGEKLKVIWGDQRNSEVKVKIYQKLLTLAENNQKNKAIKVMDLSDPTKPSVR